MKITFIPPIITDNPVETVNAMHNAKNKLSLKADVTLSATGLRLTGSAIGAAAPQFGQLEYSLLY